jgi:formylglycine-generating enzyme required for sulfatase activity
MASTKAAHRKRLWTAGAVLAGLGIAAAVALAVIGRTGAPASPAEPVVVIGDGVSTPEGMAWVPPGVFQMGSDSRLAQANERPAHTVRVKGFWMDTAHVTNEQFAQFVGQTNYVTTAETKPDWETIRVQLPPGIPRPPDGVLVPGAMVFVGTDGPVDLLDYSQWWRYVPGADWRHPQGPGSSIEGKGDHPVVQVSYADVLAYAAWAGKRLPTEAEWEYAARGGLEQATYVWGDELMPDGQPMANYWDERQGAFPVVDPKAGGAAGTLPARSFPPNGYGLHDMTGNAWQWVSDWYGADYFRRQAAVGEMIRDPQGPAKSFDPADPGVPVDAPKRVIRGGSFLCNENYCLSYRPSARRGSDPYSPMSHVGFRLVKDAPAPTHELVSRAADAR